MSWLEGWLFRKKATINGSTVGAQAMYQVPLTVNYGEANQSIPPSLVGQVLTQNSGPHQRHTFFANTRYWQFFTLAGQFAYSTSLDGMTWEAAINIRATVNGPNAHNVVFDGTYLHHRRGGRIL